MILDIYQIAGWFGVILLIIAYFLLSIKKLKFNSVIYNLLNLFGAVGIIASTVATQSWPSVALNIIWGIIAIYSIFKIIKTKPVYKELK